MGGSVEQAKCDICLSEERIVSRKYYHYNVNCDCCGGEDHFEIVRYCGNCKPYPPAKTTIHMRPKE